MAIRDKLSDALGGALRFGQDVVGDSFEKAAFARPDASESPAILPVEAAVEEPRSLLFDPFSIIDQLGYRDRPSGLTFQMLREMAKRTHVINAIIHTRINQVAAFAQPQDDEREPGFELCLVDPDATPNKDDKKRMMELSDWLLQTGSRWTPGRDNFRAFLKKLTADSLTFDAGVFEVVFNRKKEPTEFYSVDASTIRIADVPPGAEINEDPDRVRYVQVYDETIIAEYSAYELCYGIRNPRTDVRLNGYGTSEIENLMQVITAMLWGFQHNTKAFSNGVAAKGLLNFKGTIPDRKLDAFRRQFFQLVSGVNNAFRTPIINSEDVQWIDLDKSNRDMEYSAWFDFLIKLSCAQYGMDPAELNFQYGNTGQNSQMFASPVEQKLIQSRDRGLKPLLSEIQFWLNSYLIWPLDSRYKLRFVGLDVKTADEAADLGKKHVSYLKTVNEIRAEDDLDPIDGGDIILDPNWIQAQGQAQQAEMMAQQEQMAPEEEPEAAPEPPQEESAPKPTGAPERGEGEPQEPPAAKSLTSAEMFLQRRDGLRKARIVETTSVDKSSYEIEL